MFCFHTIDNAIKVFFILSLLGFINAPVMYGAFRVYQCSCHVCVITGFQHWLTNSRKIVLCNRKSTLATLISPQNISEIEVTFNNEFGNSFDHLPTPRSSKSQINVNFFLLCRRVPYSCP